MKIVHVISGMLFTGGAQMMLYKLLSCQDRSTVQAKVISLVGTGPIGEKIRALGIPVLNLGMSRGVPNPLGVYHLARWLRNDPPDVVQTWMYHADLVGGFAAKLAGGIPTAWNIRHSNLLDSDKRLSRGTAMLCARLSSWLPRRIVCCSEVARQSHADLGYAADRMIVIPNGFDLTAFTPDPAARLAVRQELKISEETLLIGLVGRFHPHKDHHTFIQAAAKLHTVFPQVHFLLCGDNVTWDNPALAGWITAAAIQHRCHLLGRREDIPRLDAALDIATSSSSSEGFPNVIGEAMACGIPCVVTDVGELPAIVGQTGCVVPAKDPHALAGAWRTLIELGPEERARRGAAARYRVAEQFNLHTIAAHYQQLHQELAAPTVPFLSPSS